MSFFLAVLFGGRLSLGYTNFDGVKIHIRGRWVKSLPLFFKLDKVGLIVPALTTWNLIEYYITDSYSGMRTPKEMIFSGYIFIIPACFFYFIQKKKLRFKEFKVFVDDDAFRKALEKTSMELDWTVDKYTNNFVRAHRNWNWTSSWGEMITIIKTGDKLLINSICDPHAFFASVASYGWNKKNVNTFIKNIKNNPTNL